MIKFRCPGKDKLNREHFVTLRDDLFSMRDKEFILSSVLYLDNDDNGSLQFIIEKGEETNIKIEQIDAYSENYGYGSLLLKALFYLVKQLGIINYTIWGNIERQDGIKKIINRINFYNSFVNLPFEELDSDINIKFYNNKVEMIEVTNIFEAGCFFYYVKEK